MRKGNSSQSIPAQTAELDALAALPEEQIDTTAYQSRGIGAARSAAFFRPMKKQLTLRIDADVIDWSKTHVPNGAGYQASIASALREYVAQHEEPRRS